jgi:choline-sulfatase
VVGEYLAEGVTRPMFMLRRGRFKYIHTETDPDQLFDLVDDPLELVNRADDERHAETVATFRQETEARWDAAAITSEVLRSQRARLAVFKALGRGELFPWDYQPLRRASEQYTRNYMDVTARDRLSRFPPTVDP